MLTCGKKVNTFQDFDAHLSQKVNPMLSDAHLFKGSVGAQEEGRGGAAAERATGGQGVQHEQDLWQVRPNQTKPNQTKPNKILFALTK
jgi:hypothetical protein